jgi:carbon monoxide dehydrogenase subunit G
MALEMNGEYVLPLERAKVCIPGCEELEKLSDTEFAAVVRVELGPVKARFKGKVRLEDLDPPNGYRIAGEGEGGVAGFAKGGATVSLSEVPEGTKLSYRAEASVGGKIAQMGQRLLAGSAKKIADKFFNNFTTALGGAPKA